LFYGICVGYVLREGRVRERNSGAWWKGEGGEVEKGKGWGVGVGFEATKVAERIRSDKLRRVKDNRQKKVKRINEVTLPYH